MRKKLLALFVLAMATLLLAACGSSKEEGKTSGSATEEKDVLRVGMEAGYAPFNWTQNDDSNGAVPIDGSKEFAGGYDVEIAKKIADGLGKELVVVKTEWDGLVLSLQSGNIDAIIAGMSPTEERKQAIDFTDNYYVSDFVMIVRADSEYAKATSIQDFKGAKVTAQLNTTNYNAIDQIEGVNKVTAMESFPAMRVALQSGAIDGYVGERPEGISAAAANPAFAYVSFDEGKGFKVNLADTSVAIGVKKGYELTSKMNEILASISDEERQKLMEAAIANQPAAE